MRRQEIPTTLVSLRNLACLHCLSVRLVREACGVPGRVTRCTVRGTDYCLQCKCKVIRCIAHPFSMVMHGIQLSCPWRRILKPGTSITRITSASS